MSISSKNKFILGIPYSSYQEKGEYKIYKTFFGILKKKKSYMYSKYYFLGIQIWSKKKSKISILMDQMHDLQDKMQEINKSINIQQQNISSLQKEDDNILNAMNSIQKELLLLKQPVMHIYNCSKEENVNIINPRNITNVNIGKGTYIAENSLITMTNIGKFCSIGPNLVCGYGIHPTKGISTAPCFYSTLKQNGMTYSAEDKVVERKTINIGNDVFIGMNVSILDGVTIGDGAIIGAGATVINDVPPYAIVGGVPAKIIKYRFNEEIIEKLLKIKWWNWDDKKLQNIEQMFFNVEEFVNKFGE